MKCFLTQKRKQDMTNLAMPVLTLTLVPVVPVVVLLVRILT